MTASMRFVRGMLDELGQLASDHEPGQRAPVGFGGRGRGDDLTPAQDADAVGDLQDLVELVRDEDDAEALRRHAAQRLQQTARLLRREDGGRLVEDEDARAEVEQAQDLDPLLLADGELPDLGARIDAETVAARSARSARARPARSPGRRPERRSPSTTFSATVNGSTSMKCW